MCNVEEREDGTIVTVAYGTTQQLNRLHTGEFTIRKQGATAAFKAAGLSFDTRFNIGQTVALPWVADFFAVPPNAPLGQSPKLGNLHASVYLAAQAVRVAAQAAKAGK